MSSTTSKPTGCASSPKVKLVPRKKFDVKSIISNAVKAEATPLSWKFVPEKKMMARISKDLNEHNLYVRGTPFFEFPWRTMEFVPYFKYLPPPQEHTAPRGRRLWQTPLFSFDKLHYQHQPSFNGQIKGFKMSYKELMENYDVQELKHKTLEHHHPQSPGWNSLTMEEEYENTIEAIFDIFNSLLRSMSLVKAWNKLLELVQTSLFNGLPPAAIYAGLMHILIRGVSNCDEFLMSSYWRHNRSQEQIVADHVSFTKGIAPSNLISAYRYEVWLHSEAIALEMRKLRFKREMKHDATKFDDVSTYFYTWKWGVWMQLNTVHQHRIASGCRQITLTGLTEDLGKSFGKGFSEELSKKIEETSEKVSEKMSEKISEKNEELGKQARTTLTDFLKEARSFTQDSAETFAQKAREVLGDLPKSMASISGILSTSSQFVQNALESIKSVFQPLLPDTISLSSISIVDIMELIGLYVLLINTTDKFLKGLILMMILYHLGVLSLVKGWISNICSYIFGGDGRIIEETNDGSSWIDILFTSTKAFSSFILGILGSLFSSRLLTKIEFRNLLRNASNLGRDFCFLDRGINSLVGLFQKFKAAISFIYEWVQLKIFGIQPRVKVLAKEIAEWCLAVRYFASEQGMTAIRLSPKAREVAEKLYARGEALLIEAGSCKEGSIPKLIVDLKRHFKDVKTIANYLTRLRAMSTFVPTMFHIQFTGQAGVGKSTLTKSFVDNILQGLYGPEYKNSFWSFNPNIEHFDGYAGQKVMITDDMFRYNDPKHLTNLIGMITNTPIMLPMANLEDKGIQLTSEVMISSTNTPYPLGKDVFCMEAVFRRRHMLIEVIIDPNVRDSATGEFSESLFQKYYPGQDSKQFPHLKFNLLKPVPKTLDTIEVYEDSEEYHERLSNFLSNIEKYNAAILKPSANKEPYDLHYERGEALPSGITYPCKNWSYHQLLSQVSARIAAFRAREGVASPEEKYNRIGEYFAEIDRIGYQENTFNRPDLEKYQFPRMKLIESLIAEMGTMADTIELDSLVENGNNVAPELHDLDFEKVFSDVVSGRITPSDSGIDPSDNAQDLLDEPTMKEKEIELTSIEGKEGSSNMTDSEVEEYHEAKETYERLSLKKEDERRRRILALKRKVLVKDDPTKSSLKWIDGKGIDVSYLPTEWLQVAKTRENNFNHPRTTQLDWLLEHVIKTEMTHSCSFDKGAKEKGAIGAHEAPVSQYFNEWTSIIQEMTREIASTNAVFPDSESFPEHLRGQKSSLSLYFLQYIEFHDNKPYFNPPFRTSSMIKGKNDIILRRYHTMHIQEMGKVVQYELPVDDSTIWYLYPSFFTFIAEFDTLQPQQQRDLVENAKWRNRYTGFYTISKLKEFATSSLQMKALNALEFLTSPIYSVYNLFPQIWNCIFKSLVSIGVIYLIKKLANLFFPQNKIEETSKYLHRGPASTVNRRIFTTSLLSNSTESVDQFTDAAFRRNVRMVRLVTSAGKRYQAQALVSGQFVILNRHIANKIQGDTELTFESPDEKLPYVYIINETNVCSDPDGDISIIYSEDFPMAASVERKLITERQYAEYEFKSQIIFLATDEKRSFITRYDGFKKCDKIEAFVSREDGERYQLSKYFTVKGTGAKGFSGSTVFTPIPIEGAHKIMGIQAWSIVDDFIFHSIAVQVLTSEKFLELKNRVSSQQIRKPIERELDFEDEYVPQERLHMLTSQSFNNVICEVPQNQSIGKVGTTAFKPTPIATLMKDDGMASKRVPAALAPGDPRLVFGRKQHPLKHSLDKYFKGSIKPFKKERLNYIENCFVRWFKVILDKKQFRKISFDEIITGTREDGSNPMALNTSPGLPFVKEHRDKKGKRDYFEIDEEGNVVNASQEILERYKEFKKSVLSGKLPLTLSYDFPKDELRPIKKALGSVEEDTPPKTRTVTCMNMFYVMLWRELTLDMWASFHRAADGTFPLCPGINPEGPEWSNAFHYLNKFKHAVDFDVSNWDGFARPELIFLVGRIISRLNNYQINSPEELAIRAILSEVMYGYIQHGTVIYQKYRGIISGFPGTAEVNSMMHLILSFYIYLEISETENMAYFQAWLDHVHQLIYGDDIILTIAPEIFEWYNGETIAAKYLEIGYPVTSAVKDSPIVKGRTLLECSFLKSTWRPLTPTIMIRKLDLDVANDLLYWVRAKDQPIQQFYMNLVDALRIAFGHGPAVYDEFLDRLNSWLHNAILEPIYIEYSDLLNDHMAVYYGVA